MDEDKINALKKSICDQIDSTFKEILKENENKTESKKNETYYQRNKKEKQYCHFCDKWISYFAYSAHNLKSEKHKANVRIHNEKLLLIKSSKTRKKKS